MTPENILQQTKNRQVPLPADIQTALKDDHLRYKIYQEISCDQAKDHHALLKFMFAEEVDLRTNQEREEHSLSDELDFFENIYHCALLLFCIGDPEDIMPMYIPSSSDFDLGCGFDTEFMLGAGAEKTISYFENIKDKDEETLNAYDFLKSCFEDEEYEDLTEWLAYRKGYFDKVS